MYLCICMVQVAHGGRNDSKNRPKQSLAEYNRVMHVESQPRALGSRWVVLFAACFGVGGG
jgi:hypothetical protein